jgi:hypothetical protein
MFAYSPFPAPANSHHLTLHSRLSQGSEHKGATAQVQRLISGHECMTYRRNCGSLAYEHGAMVRELVDRLGITAAGEEPVASDIRSSHASSARRSVPRTLISHVQCAPVHQPLKPDPMHNMPGATSALTS